MYICIHLNFSPKQFQLRTDTCTHSIGQKILLWIKFSPFKPIILPPYLQCRFLNHLPLFPLLPTNPLLPRIIILGLALMLKTDLLAKIGRRSIQIITWDVASRVFGNENKELIVRHRQAELMVQIAIVLRGFITSTTSAVERVSRVDARGRGVTPVLA